MQHLAVFDETSARKVMDGEKTVDGRFSIKAIAPFGKVSRGDTILVKISGRDICGEVTANNVLYFDKLDEQSILRIKNNWGKYMCMDDAFWSGKIGSRFATLIFLAKPHKYLVSMRFPKSDRRPWVAL